MGDEGGAQELFDRFVSASTCRAALRSFAQLCDHLRLDGGAQRPLFRTIRRRLNYWRANALWAKLERRAEQQDYRGGACSDTTCVVIGAGPCGLRAAVELAFLGARVVLLEKRDSFSRNNVLHLWPFAIHDLRGLGAKKFYGRFCAGSIDHISIRQLQLVLLKVALLLGVEVHVNVEFKQLLEPPENQSGHRVGWRLEVSPKSHPVSQLEFDVIIGADGRRNSLPGFGRKEFRGKLAIAVTANFKNRNSTAEAKVEEISGVAFIFNQRFFQDLREETGIDLENIVYYKDDTHYFVMTAKKQSLLENGVIIQDFADTASLLSRGNVDQDALQAFARKAADFSTNRQLPSLDFAVNHRGQPDVAMFDFTCMYASEHAAVIRQRRGHRLLVTLVGDSLLEPFWPMGTGVARGFLAALDASWMVCRWSRGDAPLEVLAERESVYRLLPQTNPENMQRNLGCYSLDPSSRYMNLLPLSITPAQVRHLMDTDEEAGPHVSRDDIPSPPAVGLVGQESFSRSNQLLAWCQEQTSGYRGVAVSDLTSSWKSGLALCALIHRFRPDVLDFDGLDPAAAEANARLGFEASERELGISPPMTVEEMTAAGEPDPLAMVMYLSHFYQLLRDAPTPAGCLTQSADVRAAFLTPACLLSRLGRTLSLERITMEHGDPAVRRSLSARQESCDPDGDDDMRLACGGGAGGSRVRLMANLLQAKLEETAASERRQQGEPSDGPAQASSWRPRKRTQQQEQMSFRFREKIRCQAENQGQQVLSGSSTICFFCRQRVYVMERLSAEGLFFHRGCFCCNLCGATLKIAAYSYHAASGRFFCLQHPGGHSGARTASQRTSAGSFSSLESGISGAARRRSSVFPVMEAAHEGVRPEDATARDEISEEALNRINLTQESLVQVHQEQEIPGLTQLSEEEEEEDEEEEEEEEEDEEEEDEDEEDEEEEEEEEEDEEEEDKEEEEDDDYEEEEEETTSSSGSEMDREDAGWRRGVDEDEGADDEEEELSQDEVSVSRLDFDSAPSLCETPPHAATPSTASYVSAAERPAPGRPPGRFDDITPELPATEEAEPRRRRAAKAPPPRKREAGRARALWRAVFTGTRWDGRKGGASPAAANRKTASGPRRGGPLAEDPDLESSTPLPRTSLTRRTQLRLDAVEALEIQGLSLQEKEAMKPAYVPHALAFKRSYAVKKRKAKNRVLLRESDSLSSCSTETVGLLVEPKEPSSLSVKETLFLGEPEDRGADLDSELTRRVQRAARRQAKREEVKRLHKAQMIQMKLQQVEEKQRELEERGVQVEKSLRGEADFWGESNHSSDGDLHLEGLGKPENPALMRQWFQLVQQKNALVRYESELMILARELELEDRQSRLQQELRERMAVDDHLKEEAELLKERLILEEMLEVVEQRDALVSLLEEKRLQERQEDLDLEAASLSRGLGLHWSPLM